MSEKIVNIADSVTVGDLAEALGLPVTTLIGELFKNGIAATINQRLDFETAEIIVEELGLDVQLERKQASADTARRVHTLSDHAVTRPPIVAVMGHVDHGKTSLLDAILDNKTVDGEAGGITQHISAYQATRNDRVITLLDTPGHEAFAALRQHGATLTDVVVIVVAADDGVKPQTIEAIRFARTANAKIVVAINKIDKDTANPQLVNEMAVVDGQVKKGSLARIEPEGKVVRMWEAIEAYLNRRQPLIIIAGADYGQGSSRDWAAKGVRLAGVEVIVAEGFEAGGHNGREETTTMCLIPAVRKATSLPLLAAGGIGNGQAMLAALALGADGVQIGTRFALTKESSAHENFKKLCLNLKEGDTKLLLKKLSPTRLVKGDFATAVEEAEARGASVEELRELLGKGRAKKGIFEGDLKEGELEIGQVASLFWEELSVEEVMKELIRDFKLSLENVKTQLCS